METKINFQNGIISNETTSMGCDVLVAFPITGIMVQVTTADDDDKNWFPRVNVSDEIKREIATAMAEKIFPIYCQYREAKNAGDAKLALTLMSGKNGIEWECVSLRDQFNKKYDWKTWRK